MELLQTATSNIDMEIARLKRDLDKSGFKRDLRLQAIPKRSERRKEKDLMARIRRKKKEKMEKGFDLINESAPSWKFVYRDGVP